MNKMAIVQLLILVILSCSEIKQKSTQHYSKINLEDKVVKVYTTTQNSENRLSLTDSANFVKAVQPLESEISIVVNTNKRFQKFIGIGGAITDASAEVFAKLSPEKQEELIEAYFDPEKGLGYTVVRTSIHSCDFSSESYTYINNEDKDLSSFDISHDKEFRIPMIKRAIKKAKGNILMFASPWSPPAFMKDTKNMLRGGKLLPEYYDSWALYFTKFIKAYEKEGIPIWAITIQNEPMAVQTWESCIYTAEEERDFLKNYLGPTMQKEGLGDVKIIVWDHNRDLITHRANTIFEDPEASKYAWGIGFHWYETWAGGESMYENLVRIRESYPDKKLFFTEGCAERFDSTQYQKWANAERYGESIINDFNSGTVGWTDWNILLDQNGGPNHVGNFCFAPVHADLRIDKLIYTPSFYYLGHFSKFIKANAQRLSTVSTRSHLITTSFLNEDGKIATVVMNKNDMDIKYKLIVDEKMIELNIPAHSVQTLVY